MPGKVKKTSEKSNEKEFDLEKAMARLEEINQELAKSGTSLKDSMALYKEGVELAEKCKDSLEGVEKEIQILSADE